MWTTYDLLWQAIGWFTLVWFATAGLSIILMQFLLPRAWEQIRANPPYGPGWAHALWYRRARVYGILMVLALTAGTAAALVALLNNV